MTGDDETTANMRADRVERTRARFTRPMHEHVSAPVRDEPPTPTHGESPTSGRGVLDGAFRILRALPFTPHDGQVSALARATGIPRSSVHRLLGQLRDVGAVGIVEDRYVLSPDVVLMANLVEPRAGLREALRPVMLALRDQTGATVACVVAQEGAEATVLDMVPGRETLPVDLYPGRDLPAQAAAALVVHDRGDGWAGLGPRQDWAVDREDLVDGLTCFATRIALPGGGSAALSVSTTPRHPAERSATLVRKSADLIGAQLASASRPQFPGPF